MELMLPAGSVSAAGGKSVTKLWSPPMEPPMLLAATMRKCQAYPGVRLPSTALTTWLVLVAERAVWAVKLP